MTLWIIFAAMLLAGALFVCWPLYRQQGKLTGSSLSAALAIMLIGGGLYTVIGSPGAPSGRTVTPSIDEMVASLEARMQETPEDVAGWKLLGRSFMQVQNYPGAASAFEKAVLLENGSDAQTIADFGEAVLLGNGENATSRAGPLFEQALSVTPNNPKALFYGGIAAIERGDKTLAADRWEALLALSPPPEVQELLRARIAEWRGSPVEAPADVLLSIDVSLGTAARADVSPDTTVFVIARDPDQPTPPIAAARRKASELPATVTLSNADAMIPGRPLSQFTNLEILVRASLDGQPVAQPGDWYGQTIIDTTATTSVDITIDQQVQ